MPDDPLERLRRICLALPDALEQETWGTPTFRTRQKKMFALYTDDDDGGGIALWCKAEPGLQDILVAAAPERFFVPPYVGHRGWIGIRLDGDVDWGEVAELVADSFRLTAPKGSAAR